MTEQQKFEHVGGHPLIDLVNTEVIQGSLRVDQLADNADVIAWLLDVRLITEGALQFNWHDDPTLLMQVRAFRQQMRQMLVAIVAEQPVAEETMKAINERLQHWQAQPRLIRCDGGFEQQWDFAFLQPAHLVAKLAEVAVNFLTTINLIYVRRCGNDECIRYFLDTSKNHSRRWCSMEGCGNRMKARAYYAREK